MCDRQSRMKLQKHGLTLIALIYSLNIPCFFIASGWDDLDYIRLAVQLHVHNKMVKFNLVSDDADYHEIVA